jgi:carboxypeptidase Q
MKRALVVLSALAIFSVGAFATQSAEPVDTAAIQKIRAEGLEKSQVMETMFWLTDRYGPRLTGSPWFEEAGDWAVKQLQTYGATNARKERFAYGRGWILANFHATMTEPRGMPIIGMPKAWSGGTKGTVTAEVVRADIANEADAAKYKGKLAGKIVLTQSVRAVRMFDQGDGTVLRYADQDGKWLKEALTMPAARGGGGRAGGGRGAGAAAAGAAGAGAGAGDGGAAAAGAAGAAGAGAGRAGAAGAPAPGGAAAGRGGRGGGFNVNQFYKAEGVVAIFDRGGNSDMAAGGSDLTWQQQHPDGGTFAVQSGGSAAADPSTALPQVTLAVEHYNRMVRLVEHNVPVKVELNIDVRFNEETPARPTGFNVVAEIPGTDKADEIVLIGAHFDSWHGATGATDNAAGSAAMMEAIRIIKTTGLRPRRTIRIALWGAEEGGLVGSRTYAREHLGTAQEPRPELAKTVAYFNLDNGTGKVRGIWMQSNSGVKPIFESWIAPLKDLGVEILGPRSVTQTDHTSFDSLGVPAFQFVQERYEYNSRTHHTNMDFLDRVQPDDMKQIATVAAVFAWQAANRDQPLPRKPAAAPAGGGQ